MTPEELKARIDQAAQVVASLQRRDKAQWAKISELYKLVEAHGQQIMALQAELAWEDDIPYHEEFPQL